jgi:hypothetical protein
MPITADDAIPHGIKAIRANLNMIFYRHGSPDSRKWSYLTVGHAAKKSRVNLKPLFIPYSP